MDEFIKEIIKNLKVCKDDALLFDNELSEEIKIKKENFKELTTVKSKKSIAFIDGGNLEIVKTPSISLFFNRIYYCVYHKNKRIRKNKTEFYSLIISNKENIKAVCFPKVIKDYVFNPFDKTLSFANKRVSLEKIGNLVRRLAELSAIQNIPADYSVIDGSLEYTHKYEKEIISNFKNIAGLSKTTSLITKKGLSASGLLNYLGGKKEWFYNAGKDIYFIKLHKNSKHSFRIDYSGEDFLELLNLLKENSKDPVFLGYPYGLIEADKFARVSKKECELLKIQIITKIKENSESLELHLNSMNAHDILDNIS
jgi:hypothetical protein